MENSHSSAQKSLAAACSPCSRSAAAAAPARSATTMPLQCSQIGEEHQSRDFKLETATSLLAGTLDVHTITAGARSMQLMLTGAAGRRRGRSPSDSSLL